MEKVHIYQNDSGVWLYSLYRRSGFWRSGLGGFATREEAESAAREACNREWLALPVTLP